MHKAYSVPTDRPRLAVVAAALLTLSALPVHAATFTPPEGCKLEITVQNRGCTVSQYYRCDSDAAGDQRVTIFTTDGPVYQSRIDKETRWMESANLVNGLTDVLEPEAKDHASFSTLEKTGRDDFDFWTLSNDGQRNSPAPPHRPAVPP